MAYLLLCGVFRVMVIRVGFLMKSLIVVEITLTLEKLWRSREIRFGNKINFILSAEEKF